MKTKIRNRHDLMIHCVELREDPKSFRDTWRFYVCEGYNYEEAYKLAELEYQTLCRATGLDKVLPDRRYASYDSFRLSQKNVSQLL